ncbi:MAG: hypothetical protein K2H29_04600 [Oscillospiraceae bacterium]|nr:hypothetical protein [Oscillospiraceae bacterium]MDE5884343.1 hypothetical protein [Oscillospiraceae bacterium]
MRKYTNQDFELFKKEVMDNNAKNPWIISELELLHKFEVEVNHETALHQVIELNKKYGTRLSRGQSKLPDECDELANYIASDSFQNRIKTTDKDVAASLVMDLAKAAKTRGRFLLSFASKYCHHCNPNMYPIFDSVNENYLKEHHSYSGKRDYRKYMDAYSLFCKDIEVDLESATDKEIGFWVDKFINNIEK